MSKKQNAEEDYITTPISVLSYITDLERQLAEAREALSSIGGILPTVHSSDREIHKIINKF